MHDMCLMEELVPSIGTSVPSPSLLAVVISQSDATLQNVGRHFSDAVDASPSDKEFDMDFDNPLDFRDESNVICKTHLISITDDGKIWNWLLTSEGAMDDSINASDAENVTESSKLPVLSSSDSMKGVAKQTDDVKIGKGYQSASTVNHDNLTLKVLHKTNGCLMIGLIFLCLFIYFINLNLDADQPCWSASSAFFNGDYVGGTISFFDSYFGK